MRVIGDEAVLGLRLDNVKYPAWGIKGGHAGRPGRVIVNPGAPDERQLRPMSDQNQLRKGDLLRIMTGGGGGWGHPFDRPEASVRLDVLDGFISSDSALADYGVSLTPDLDIDVEATRKLRAEIPCDGNMFNHGQGITTKEGLSS